MISSCQNQALSNGKKLFLISTNGIHIYSVKEKMLINTLFDELKFFKVDNINPRNIIKLIKQYILKICYRSKWNGV